MLRHVWCHTVWRLPGPPSVHINHIIKSQLLFCYCVIDRRYNQQHHDEACHNMQYTPSSTYITDSQLSRMRTCSADHHQVTSSSLTYSSSPALYDKSDSVGSIVRLQQGGKQCYGSVPPTSYCVTLTKSGEPMCEMALAAGSQQQQQQQRYHGTGITDHHYHCHRPGDAAAGIESLWTCVEYMHYIFLTPHLHIDVDYM